MAREIHGQWVSLSVLVCAAFTACDQAPEGIDEASESVSVVHRAEDLEAMRRHIDNLYDRNDVVHTFKAISGDVVDCVPVDSQPGMRAPDMQGHVIMSAPTTAPRGDMEEAPQSEDQRNLALARMFELEGLDDDGAERSCPDHTIPIRRLELAALTRFRTLGEALDKYPRGSGARRADFALTLDDADSALDASDGSVEPPKQGASDYHQHAHAVQSVQNRGAQATLSVWNPYVQQPDEFSLSQVWVYRGVDATLETVEAGWQRFRQKYGDWNSRLFIYFTPDNYKTGGCYNLDCAAFVQTNKSVLIGGKFDKYSVKDGYQKEVTVSWYKDGDAGHWWLRIDGSWVGYYPRTKFDSLGLRDRAAAVDFGGEILDTQLNGVHTHTDMGSGMFAYHGFRKAAQQRNVRYIDTDLKYHDAVLSPSATDVSCYDILLHKSPTWGTYFYFGGVGYSAACE